MAFYAHSLNSPHPLVTPSRSTHLSAPHTFSHRTHLLLAAQTSRDGIHIDHEWVYAHQPLLPKKGLKQAAFDSGLIFPAAALLSREREHRIYFEVLTRYISTSPPLDAT